MQDSRRGIQPSYNGQIAVDEKEQVIVASDITQETTDHHELIKVVEVVEQNLVARHYNPAFAVSTR